MTPSINERQEYLTIIAAPATQAMAQFKARGLDQQGYTIAAKIGRHQFSLVSGDDSTDLFSGAGLIAATFSRKVSA